jgi:hypothetical protein
MSFDTMVEEEAPRSSRPAMPSQEIASLGRYAPRDKTSPVRVRVKEPGTEKYVFTISMEVYVNRLTSKPTELTDEEVAAIDGGNDAIDSRKNAKWMCEWAASWNLGGDSSVPDFVRDDEIVPIEPAMVELVPLWVRNQIVDAAMELINPNRNGSRGPRRR